MFPRLSDLAKSVTFYAIVFALVTAVGLASSILGPATLVVAMLTPTVAALLMLLVVTRDGYSRAGWAGLGLHRLGIQGWPLAILAPLAVLGAAYGVVWSTGIAAFTPPPGLDAEGWAIGLGTGLFENLVIATLTFSLGEELGWRGYLLPRLATVLGNTRGMAATGFLHGLFHMPIIFLTPYYHPDGNRLLIVPLFLTATTVGGLLFGYLRLHTQSVWTASLAHSAHNYYWGLFSTLTIATSPVAAEYLAGETGILPIVGYGLLATWLLFRASPRSARPTTSGVRIPGVAVF